MTLRGLLCCFGFQCSPASPRAIQQPSPPTDSPSTASCSTPTGPYRFLFDEEDANRVTGVNNSGSKYAVEQPVPERTTPYEEGIERMLQEEELARERKRQLKGS